MQQQNKYAKALAAAFPFTVPILAGFLFLGIAYGIFMNVSGYSALYPFAMSLTIFAGSMEFVTVDLLAGVFNPLGAFFMALLVNARHLFYGISMLDRFKGTGRKKFYLIFGMCDESFSINYTARIPLGVDAGWFLFFVTLLNHCYWVTGATLGGLLGSLIHFNTEGLDFVMVALFVVIFLEQWRKDQNMSARCWELPPAWPACCYLARTNLFCPLWQPSSPYWLCCVPGWKRMVILHDCCTAMDHDWHGSFRNNGYAFFAFFAFSFWQADAAFCPLLRPVFTRRGAGDAGCLQPERCKPADKPAWDPGTFGRRRCSWIAFYGKKQMLLSIAGGTVCYMLLVQFIF